MIEQLHRRWLTSLPTRGKNFSRCARWLTASLLGWYLVCVVSQTALAQSDDEAVVNREYPLKALFIYNFGSYIEWPPSAFGDRQPFVIGILGSSRIESTLQEIAAAKTINGRRIVVERFGSAGATKPCQILFVGREVTPQEQQLLVERLRNEQVLIVGESRGFAQRGAVVNFFVEANKIRFEINVEAARRHSLKISAKLLALAKLVEPGDAAIR